MKQLNGTSIAWLSSDSRGPILIESTVSIGRSPSCNVQLDNPKVSRRHAIIHVAGKSEFWISDMGGCNGVYVNERRIHTSFRLGHGDQIRILDFGFQFLCPDATNLTSAPDDSASHTIPCCSVENRWLLVADIVDGTRWAANLETEEYPRQLGQWFRKCRCIVEATHGSVNNYVGDGFLADWPDGPEAAENIRRAVLVFAAQLRVGNMPFRMALHYGEVTASGVGTVGEESLLGPQVNFVFRMEKVAAHHGHPILISEVAAERLERLMMLKKTPAMDVPSFGSDHLFFTMPEELPLNAEDRGLPAIRDMIQSRKFDASI